MSIRVPARHPGKSMAAKIIGQAVARERMHKAAAIVEDCVHLMRGHMTEWQDIENMDGTARRLTCDIRVRGRVMPVTVTGGTIWVNRSQFIPGSNAPIQDTSTVLSAIEEHMKKGERA